jgi:hypothetical protein
MLPPTLEQGAQRYWSTNTRTRFISYLLKKSSLWRTGDRLRCSMPYFERLYSMVKPYLATNRLDTSLHECLSIGSTLTSGSLLDMCGAVLCPFLTLFDCGPSWTERRAGAISQSV